MNIHPAIDNVTRSYSRSSDSQWMNTALISHRGTTIAFAQTSNGRFYYTILNLNDPNLESTRDVDAWLANPEPVSFPVEVITAGAEAVSLRELPVVMKNGASPLKNQYVPLSERHPYRSTTASLSKPGAPFTVISDGIYIYLFRQSEPGGQEPATILMDRFNFNGKSLSLKIETRYQRSRNRSLPKNPKDTLGFKDLNKNLFVEPTHQLNLLLPGAVYNGNFAVTLVPTLVPDERNWQFFTFNDQDNRVYCVSIPRGKDGLFDERAKTFYISANQEKFPQVFSLHPGMDPDGNPLVEWNPDGGKQVFSFELPGTDPTCYGMDAVVYARQFYPNLKPGESLGYSPVAKPMLGEARLLLAISAKSGPEAAQANHITLDFGVSRDGRLVNPERESRLASSDQPVTIQSLDEVVADLPRIGALSESDRDQQRFVLSDAFDRQFRIQSYTIDLYEHAHFDGMRLPLHYEVPTLAALAAGNVSQLYELKPMKFNDKVSSARVNSDAIIVEFYDDVDNGIPSDLLFAVNHAADIPSFDRNVGKTNDRLSAVVIKLKITEEMQTFIDRYRLLTVDDNAQIIANVSDLHQQKRDKEAELKTVFDTHSGLRQHWENREAELARLPQKRELRTQKQAHQHALETQRTAVVQDFNSRFKDAEHRVYLFKSARPSDGEKAISSNYCEYNFQDIDEYFYKEGEEKGKKKPYVGTTYRVSSHDTASAANVACDVLSVSFYDDIDGGIASDLLFKVDGREYIPSFDGKTKDTNDRLSALVITPLATALDPVLDKYKKLGEDIATTQSEITTLNTDIAQLEDLQRLLNTVQGLYDSIALVDQQLEQAMLRGASDVRYAMPTLQTYTTQGSTLDGAVLNFTYGAYPPRLFHNADGRVSLLFRGANNEFMIAYYDVMLGADDNNQTHWVGERPGFALALDHHPITSPHSADKHTNTGQLSLEAWVKPALNRDAPLLTHRDYVVNLKAEQSQFPEIQYNVHGKSGVVASKLPLNEWSHLALVYNRSYGLKFDGSAYVDCGTQKTLDITRDMTLEVTLMLSDTGSGVQSIIHKGGVRDGQTTVGYRLSVDEHNTVYWVYTAEAGKGQVQREQNNTYINLEPNKPTKLAVTREYIVDQAKLDAELAKKNDDPNYVMDMSFAYFQHTFYQDGKPVHHNYARHVTVEDGTINLTPTGSDDAFLIGIDHKHERGFVGVISEVRVWNTARTEAEIHADIDSTETGLVSWWRMEENEGFTIEDSKANNHGTIVGAEWTQNPDPDASTLKVYVNGVESSTTPLSPPLNRTGQSLMVGSQPGSNDVFSGELEEIRIWSQARSEEQIQDNLFRRLDSEFEDLLSYYDCEVDPQWRLLDQSGHGAHIPIQASQLIYSTAPIGPDVPLLRSALAGIKTTFNGYIHSPAAMAEYGELQRDEAGNDAGIHKRVYAFITDGQWHLLTGFKIGDLSVEWVGQAQFDPQVIGFIEGAPPVPSENLTENEDDGYNGASSVDISAAESTMYAMGTSHERTAHMAMDMMVGVGVESETEVGVGVATTTEKTEFSAGLRASFEMNSTATEETEVGFGENIVRLSSMSLTGYWESDDASHKAIGKRYVPQNVGYALVQSETVDIFALRLKRSGLMISKIIRKNPDIPRDWNIIMFPINPRYTKQGTLDGKVGHQPDDHYPAATQYSPDSSYFKPLEAYRLKRNIQQQAQTEREKYVQFDSSFFMFSRPDIPQIHKRDIVNTYVWTADGGFFAESTETMDSLTEVSAGSFSWDLSLGVAVEGKFIAGKVGPVGNFELMLGGGVTTTAMKSASSESAFSIEVALDPENDIFDRDENGQLKMVDGKPQKRAGKVDAYRFLTFYLSPDNNHLQELKNKVVDPTWLAGDDPNAAAMQAALNNTEARPWRILHRVTFISRVLPPFASSGAAGDTLTFDDTMVSSNYELIQRLEPFVVGKLGNYQQFADAIRNTIAQYLPVYQNKVEDIVRLMGAYYEMFPADATDHHTAAGYADVLASGDMVSSASIPASAPAGELAGASSAPDQIVYIHGIGETYQQILHDAGIFTFEQVANMTVEALEGLIREKSGRRPPKGDAAHWIEQAKLAQAGKWAELEAYQRKLK